MGHHWTSEGVAEAVDRSTKEIQGGVGVQLDWDKLVRTCVVKSSLVQNLHEFDRLYKGISVKFLRAVVQRLHLVDYVEKHEGWPEVIGGEKRS